MIGHAKILRTVMQKKPDQAQPRLTTDIESRLGAGPGLRRAIRLEFFTTTQVSPASRPS